MSQALTWNRITGAAQTSAKTTESESYGSGLTLRVIIYCVTMKLSYKFYSQLVKNFLNNFANKPNADRSANENITSFAELKCPNRQFVQSLLMSRPYITKFTIRP